MKNNPTKTFDFGVTSKNVHAVLERLAESLDARRFVLNFAETDSPKFQAEILSRHSLLTCKLVLRRIECKDKKTMHEIIPDRTVSLYQLNNWYENSPVLFKPKYSMSIETFARSLGMLDKLAEIEAVFCNERLSTMSMHLDKDPMWRIWNGVMWVDIDPWKFAVEMDLNGAAE